MEGSIMAGTALSTIVPIACKCVQGHRMLSLITWWSHLVRGSAIAATEYKQSH